jgi:ferritin-like metal-binding protein YciE
MEMFMSHTDAAMDVYLTGLRNKHAVETQAIGTIPNELPGMKPYPELHAKMQQDKDRSVTQAARLDDLLARHSTSKSFAKEAVTGAVRLWPVRSCHSLG